jgi:hypothetical protein
MEEMNHYKVSAKDDKDKKIDFLRRFIKVFNTRFI